MNPQGQLLSRRVKDELKVFNLPSILAFPTSWDIVVQTGYSLARIGDGEILNAVGMKCGFENGKDAELAQTIIDVLSKPKRKCLVAINRAHFYDTENTIPAVNRYSASFWNYLPNKDALFSKMTSPFYLDACISIPRHHYLMPQGFWIEYFSRVTAYLSTLRIMLVTGDEDSIPFYRKFSRDLRVVPCMKRGAWQERARIIADLRRLNSTNSWTVVAVCGPTATYLAYELCDEMRVLDLGHLSREYQYWQGNSDPTRDLAQFFGS